MISPSTCDEGFVGFRARINTVSEALGGGRDIRKAVAEEFKLALLNEQRFGHVRDLHRWPDWTEASETDFNVAGERIFRLLQAVPQERLIGKAAWGAAHLELYETSVYLVGGEFRLCVGLITESEGYDSRERKNVKKWQPFVTDTGNYIAHGSIYGTGGVKTVRARSAAAASASLRKLIERHFNISFDNVMAVPA